MQKSSKKQLIKECGYISKVVDVPEVDEASLWVGPQDPGGPSPHLASNDEWPLEAAWPLDEVPWWPHVHKVDNSLTPVLKDEGPRC